MKINFSKYQGAGNDFVIIDNREILINPEPDVVNRLCHRNYGIGADGLMLLEADPDYDFRMRYFNSDGHESTMCGNGGRCIVKFAERIGLINENTRFIGIDGRHIATIAGNGVINLKMKDVDSIEVDEDYFLLDTGSPHYVHFVEDINRVDVATEGRFIRNSFNPENGGVNVNFVQVTPKGLRVRTYERGVEAETLACGTGAVAAAIVANHWLENEQELFQVEAMGGNLEVSFERKDEVKYQNIWLKGPALHVFDGVVEV